MTLGLCGCRSVPGDCDVTQVKTIQQMLRCIPLVADADVLEVLMEDEDLLIVAKPAGRKPRRSVDPSPNHGNWAAPGLPVSPPNRYHGGALLNQVPSAASAFCRFSLPFASCDDSRGPLPLWDFAAHRASSGLRHQRCNGAGQDAELCPQPGSCLAASAQKPGSARSTHKVCLILS